MGAEFSLGRLLRDTGRLAEAEPILVGLLERRRRLLGEGHTSTILSIQGVAGLRQAQGRFAEAETLLLDAYSATEASELLGTIVSLYEAWDKPEQVEQWRAMRDSP